jgi:23S rRNA (cytidine1920-2'-O)/16S rRNA (cytidine1409-2'-O)-methyltransferase
VVAFAARCLETLARVVEPLHHLTICLSCAILRGVQKERLDVLLVTRGLAESRTAAQKLILAGQVYIGEGRADKPGMQVAVDAPLHVRQGLPFVSRGGNKLQAALNAFALNVEGWVCADVGASTGGFTDCLLQRGAAHVYAIDVGYGQLDWKLRQNPRVIVMERTNARYLTSLPELIDLIVIDASFISLTLLLQGAAGWLKSEGHIVALIKPQFEAGRDQVGRGGVVRDATIHADVLQRVLTWANEHRMPPYGLIRSPIKGPAGNVEFLAHLRHGSAPRPADEIAAMAAAGSQPISE